MKLTSLCVYCGSSMGTAPAIMAAADRFGGLMAASGVELVYGGGGVGLMGACARSAEVEAGFHEVSELIITDSMHERKQLMFERSQAFVALPGGIGTVEETIEMLTWAQLGRHSYPIVIANLEGFWTPLIELLDHIIKAGFARSDIRRIYSVVDKVEDIIPRIETSL